ncbi:MAG: 3'-5' exonuclease, partial [Candidatus Binatia bacterium]
AVRKIISANDEINAEKARRLEGESLAGWLKDEVLDKAVILNAHGEQARAQPKDIAILFRKLTDIHDYLEPFRRENIRYVVEGERHFYAAKEIIDAVNLLRAIDNPHDRLALVGVLRSPLGGLTDRQIYQLHRAKLLDYREAERLSGQTFPPTLSELYATLATLNDEIRLMAVGAAVTHVFACLPVKLLAACSFNGEQAVANLEKLCQQADLLGRQGATTLKAAIHQLEQRVLDVKEEGESVLAEENLDAVRIMSVHKAKGLEFPIVILAGCHTGTDQRRTADGEALFDWSSGLTGMRVGPFSDLAGLYIGEKTRLRAEEEQKRVLYVAMTRAREHLVISCAPSGRHSSGSFLSMLDESLHSDIETAETSQTIRAGDGGIEIEVLTQTLAAPGKAKGKRQSKKKANWQPFVDTWARRRRAYDKAIETSPFVTPTLLKRQEDVTAEARASIVRSPYPRTTALMVGDWAHRFLEHCDFTAGAKDVQTQLKNFIAPGLPSDTQLDASEIAAELQDIFRDFQRSNAYAELASARILGREVPLLMPWNGQIMEGVIDVIYERSGLLYLADYKTDRIDHNELTQAAAPYRQQAEIYSQATRQSLGREVAAFKLIFLRVGEAMEIAPEKNQELKLF